ncbi:ATP-binding protein [Teichococcus coralli]|nr:ATP-binding protein [Pseudoroseomonas coralli]
MIRLRALRSAGTQARRGGRRFSRIVAGSTVALGLLVLAGWSLHGPLRSGLAPAQPPMVALTAIGILLLGLALWLGLPGMARPRASRSFAALAGMVGLGGLLEGVLPSPWRLDALAQDLLFGPLPPDAGMAGATAAGILAIALGLLLQNARRPWLCHASRLAALAGLLIALVGLLGYAYHLTAVRQDGPFSRMALSTALALAALALGTLLSRPWQFGALAVAGGGGAVLRRLLPVVLLAPAGLGWLQLRAVQAGWLAPEMATAALVAILSLSLAALTLRSAQVVGGRSRAQRRMNALLEQRVAARGAELAQVQEALVQAQKMEAVGQLTAGLAHDFNNLLTGIIGGLELLRGRMAQGRTDGLERYLGTAEEAARRAAVLTHRLLAFSRRQALDPRPTDANRLVQGMVELIARTSGPGIALETALAAGLRPALCDPHLLENAILNLCINARDAMPSGGRLTIGTANQEIDAREARTWSLPPGDYVLVWVADTGTGMAPDVATRAFDPFFTTKPAGEGTGLGLSMIYGFARQSGGQARIQSRPGEGTRVSLCLPSYHGQAEGEAPRPERGAMPRAPGGETVLVVDDEAAVRMVVAEVLQDLGYVALEAADAEAGLEVLRAGARVDLLVTDIGLPGGLDGRQLAAAARRLRPALRVLFITGYAETAVGEDGRPQPELNVLAKPFTMTALAARIQGLAAAA